MSTAASNSGSRRRPYGTWSIAAATLATILGCGGASVPTAHLAGKVTLGGKPLPDDAEASIIFFDESVENDDAKVTVPINSADSTYDSPNTPQGDIRAYFSITRKGPPKISERTGEQYQDIINLVPAKYATGIPLQVNGDNTSHDFELSHR